MLLRHGATLIPDNTGLTPWIAACLRGNETIVKLFLSVDGFNVNRTEPGNMSGLFVACSSGHAHIVSMLMKHGANVNVSAFLFHVSPLHTSVSMNHNDVVKLLLQHPQTKDILNKRTLGGATALYMAIEEENLLVTKMLLDSGANPCISVRGKTAFDKALETANAEIVFIVKQATIEPIRFHLLAWSRKRANLWNLDLDQDEKVVHIAAHVVHAWNDDLFHELETYLLPSWAV